MVEISVEPYKFPKVSFDVGKAIEAIKKKTKMDINYFVDIDKDSLSAEIGVDDIYACSIAKLKNPFAIKRNLDFFPTKEIQGALAILPTKENKIKVQIGQIKNISSINKLDKPFSIQISYDVGIDDKRIAAAVFRSFFMQKVMPLYASNVVNLNRIKELSKNPNNQKDLVNLIKRINLAAVRFNKVQWSRMNAVNIEAFYSGIPYMLNLDKTGDYKYSLVCTCNYSGINTPPINTLKGILGIKENMSSYKYRLLKARFCLDLLTDKKRIERFYKDIYNNKFLLYHFDFSVMLYHIAGLIFFGYEKEISKDILDSLEYLSDRLFSITVSDESALSIKEGLFEIANRINPKFIEPLKQALKNINLNIGYLSFDKYLNAIIPVLSELAEKEYSYAILDDLEEINEDFMVLRVEFDSHGTSKLTFEPIYSIYTTADKPYYITKKPLKPERKGFVILLVSGENEEKTKEMYKIFKDAVKGVNKELYNLIGNSTSKKLSLFTGLPSCPSDIIKISTNYIALFQRTLNKLVELKDEIDTVFILRLYTKENSPQYGIDRDFYNILSHSADIFGLDVVSAGIDISTTENINFRANATVSKLRCNKIAYENDTERNLALVLVNPYEYILGRMNSKLVRAKSAKIFVETLIITKDGKIKGPKPFVIEDTGEIGNHLKDLGINNGDYLVVGHNGVRLVEENMEHFMKVLSDNYKVMRYYTCPILFPLGSLQNTDSVSYYTDKELVFTRIKEIKRIKQKQGIEQLTHRGFVLHAYNFKYNLENVKEILKLIAPNTNMVKQEEELKTRFIERFILGTEQYSYLREYGIQSNDGIKYNILFAKMLFNYLEISKKAKKQDASNR